MIDIPLLYEGDCLDVMPHLAECSVDTLITDPPYHLTTDKKGGTGPASLNLNSPAGRARISTGFMGKKWDGGCIAHDPKVWQNVLRVAKPGAFLFAFGGTRTHHRLMVAIEDAGWEIRDCIMWLYGTGFPKSYNIGKGIDKAAGAERPATDAARKWDGWGTALKPAWEPIIVAMKPLDGTFADNAERHGVAGLNIDGARIGRAATDVNGRSLTGSKESENRSMSGKNYARTPRPDAVGRWPANVILDEEAGAMLDEQSGERPSGASRFFYCAKASKSERNAGLEGMEKRASGLHDDDNYRKPGERKANHTAPMPRANHHPTVKPAALMEYLCRLTATPDGGTVLDPFMGSGTTGIAAVRTGRDFIGIEIEPDYMTIARLRIGHVMDEMDFPDYLPDEPEVRGQGELFD